MSSAIPLTSYFRNKPEELIIRNKLCLKFLIYYNINVFKLCLTSEETGSISHYVGSIC